jgi:hypothetical protein
MAEQKINPEQVIDIAISMISDEPPKTLFGRILRWIKKINQVKKALR